MTIAFRSYEPTEDGEAIRIAVVPLLDRSVPRNQAFLGISILEDGELHFVLCHEDGVNDHGLVSALFDAIASASPDGLPGIRKMIEEANLDTGA
jgi:hypothetical protein